MGVYLNSIKSLTMYQNEVSMLYFVYKTMLLEELDPLVERISVNMDMDVKIIKSIFHI